MMKPIKPVYSAIILVFMTGLMSPLYSEGSEGSAEAQVGIGQQINSFIDSISGFLAEFLFFDVSFGIFDSSVVDKATGEVISGEVVTMPFLVVFLAVGAVFFTFYHRFINLRGFKHAIDIVRGKYSKDDDVGDITPFRALTSALSATVGLGNIAGVSVAMVTGGPGALFWMMFLGLFGMSSKFHESTLAQLYRIKNKDGSISGGPMYYLSKGIAENVPSLASLGKILAVLFSFFCIMGALGGGNMFQANQAFEGFFATFVKPYASGDLVVLEKNVSYGFGLVLAALVAVVVIGGITRIGAATSRIVPFMAALYISTCLIIIFYNIAEVPAMIALVFHEAFCGESIFGGLIGTLIIGFKRAAFSSEAGLGSSAIAHSAAKTDDPVKEGFVASLEPFIDTIVICAITGMTVLITGAYKIEGGSSVTLYAFQQAPFFGEGFASILTVCIILFAFSTMISWCYYGERAWGYLFGVDSKIGGIHSIIIFRLIFVVFIFIGTVSNLTTIINFADLMLLSMAFPNIIGGVILAPLVKRELQRYWKEHKAKS